MSTRNSNKKSAWTVEDVYNMLFATYGNAHVEANKARAKEAAKYTIPYISEKEIRLSTGRYNTGKISTNLLDSIYDSAKRTGVPIEIALGLAGRESTLGIGRGFKKGKSISGTDLFSNWQQIQTMPNTKSQIARWNELLGKDKSELTEDDYSFKSDFLIRSQEALENTKSLKENPIDNALRFYLEGKYNPGDPNHNKMVEEDAKVIMSDPAIQKWYQNKINNEMKCGGRRKARLGLDIREGGIAQPIAPNMYYMIGRSHDDGGIAIGPNNKNGLEVEGGEVVKVGNKDIKVFSSVPLLRGVSPAQLVMGGANPNKVFKAQEDFKDRNHINDDGTTYENGGEKIINLEDVPSSFRGKKINGRFVQFGVPPAVNKAHKLDINFKQRMSALNDDMKDFIMDGIKYGYNIMPKPLKKYYLKGVDILNRPGVKDISNAAQKITQVQAIVDEKKMGGLSRSEDYGSKKKPYPSVSKSDFAGGHRSYPIPTKADAVDALRLAGLHGRSDVKAKVYRKYPELRKKKELGGDENVLPEVVVTAKKPKTFFEKLDDYANIGEKALAIPNLALSGATLISPNPFTAVGSYITGLGGAAIDVYQGARSAYKGDWFNVGKNAIDIGLSLVGLRALKNAKKLNELDKSLEASGAVREYVTKYVGRGRGRRKVTFTKEKNKAINEEGIGYASIPGGTVLSMMKSDRKKKEFGGSMIYSINGNVKNSLMSLRPKAKYGKVDRKNKDVKVGPDGLIYKRAADGEWHTDGTKHVAFKEIEHNNRTARRDIYNAGSTPLDSYTYGDNMFSHVATEVPEEIKTAKLKSTKPIRTAVSGYAHEDDKETKKIGSLTYEKDENGKWVVAKTNSTVSTRDSGKTKEYGVSAYGMTRKGVSHPNEQYNYHPLTGEKLDEKGVIKSETPSVERVTKTSQKSTPRGRGTSTSTTAVSRGTAKVESEKPATATNPMEARYASRVQKGKAITQEVTPKTSVTYNESEDKNPDKFRYTRATGFQAGKSPSSTGGQKRTETKDTEGRWVGQYKTTNVGDWIGLGSNVLGSIGSYLLTKKAIDKTPEPIKPVMAQAAKLKTKYNIEPQLAESREAELTNRRAVRSNTQSSNTSLAREQRLMNEARNARNTLYGQKENIETQLINQDKLNRQSVMSDNIRTYNDYLNRVYANKLNKNQLKISNINNLISGLTSGVNSILSTVDSRRMTNNTLRAIAAANPNVDARLIGGFDYYIDPITKKKYNKYQQYVGTING